MTQKYHETNIKVHVQHTQHRTRNSVRALLAHVQVSVGFHERENGSGSAQVVQRGWCEESGASSALGRE